MRVSPADIFEAFRLGLITQAEARLAFLSVLQEYSDALPFRDEEPQPA